MFREELHGAFDAISPSPELLDRISAMMNEEVSRPAPTIKMNAVRYGGIAAALVIAAGATFAAVNLSGNEIKTGKASEAVVADASDSDGNNETYAGAVGDADAAVAADEASEAAEDADVQERALKSVLTETAEEAECADIPAAEAYSAEDIAEESADEAALFAASEIQAEDDSAGDISKAYAVDIEEYAVTTTAETSAQTTTTRPFVREKNDGEDKSDETTSEYAVPAVPVSAEESEKSNNETGAASDGVTLTDEDADAEEITNDDIVTICDTSPITCDDDSADEECAEETDDLNPGFGYDDDEDSDSIDSYITDEDGDDAVAVESFTANPGTSGYADEFIYEHPFSAKFREIPDELLMIPDGVKLLTNDGYIMGDRWHEYFRAVTKGYTASDEDAAPIDANTESEPWDIFTIDDFANVHNFIKYFAIPETDARKALSGSFTPAQLDILFSDDRLAVTKAFASEYAIVKDDKAFSPKWLNRHSVREWTANGITREDVLAKYDLLSSVPLLRSDLQAKLTSKLDLFVSEKTASSDSAENERQ